MAVKWTCWWINNFNWKKK